MRTAIRFAATGALFAVLALAAAPAAQAHGPALRDHHEPIPVGAITDLGDLLIVGNLGYDFARLLGS
ncbi:hypothetical protein AB0D08_01755 [Kitasatospora sp. NPDC048540]|uniref:hypothetical protein n=1 Tax=unclassified Kitasatospora TaxID=2633591 RepID=UPI00053B90F6|nr:hypothetical protein [Kitasatospora sp. MBT63]